MLFFFIKSFADSIINREKQSQVLSEFHNLDPPASLGSLLLHSLKNYFKYTDFLLFQVSVSFFFPPDYSFCLRPPNKQAIVLRVKSRVVSIMPLLKQKVTIPLYIVCAHLSTVYIYNHLVHFFVNTSSTKTSGMIVHSLSCVWLFETP